MGLYTRPDSPSWWYHVDGTAIRKSTGIPHTGASPEQTKELKRQAQHQYIAATLAHAKGDLKNEKPTIGFKAFATWHETHVLAHQRGAERARSMLRQLGLYFNRYTSLTEITQAAAKEWMTWRKQQVSAATVNRELDTLKGLLRSAVPLYLEANPLAGLKRFRVTETEPRVLTHEEEARLLANCGPEDRALVIMALDTLLRLSSVLWLEWPQVKFDQRVILPLNAKVKTRDKPISTRLHVALSALPRFGRFVFASFHQKGNGKTAAKNLLTRRFDHLCRRADIRHGRAVDGITFHCLRHTGATRALQAGHSLRTVMDLGGWTDERTVIRYLHATDMDVRSAAESIGGATIVKKTG